MSYSRIPLKLRRRGEDMYARAELVEKFLSLGLTQGDVIAETGYSKATLSNYFNGRQDNAKIESVIKRLISSRGVAV